MTKISELVINRKDVKFNDIPSDWKDSFNLFMFGQTIYGDDEGNFIAYYHDFMRWYWQNQTELDRDNKIDDILE